MMGLFFSKHQFRNDRITTSIPKLASGSEVYPIQGIGYFKILKISMFFEKIKFSLI
jgi:hypothetical protein